MTTTHTDLIVYNLHNELTRIGIDKKIPDFSHVQECYAFTRDLKSQIVETLVDLVSLLPVMEKLFKTNPKIERTIRYISALPPSQDPETESKKYFALKILDHMRCRRDEKLQLLSRLNYMQNRIEKICQKERADYVYQLNQIFDEYLEAKNDATIATCQIAIAYLERQCNTHFDIDLFDYPPELLVAFFSYLSLKDLCNLQLVCKKLTPYGKDQLLIKNAFQREFPHLHCTRKSTQPIKLLRKKHLLLSKVKKFNKSQLQSSEDYEYLNAHVIHARNVPHMDFVAIWYIEPNNRRVIRFPQCQHILFDKEKYNEIYSSYFTGDRFPFHLLPISYDSFFCCCEHTSTTDYTNGDMTIFTKDKKVPIPQEISKYISMHSFIWKYDNNVVFIDPHCKVIADLENQTFSNSETFPELAQHLDIAKNERIFKCHKKYFYFQKGFELFRYNLFLDESKPEKVLDLEIDPFQKPLQFCRIVNNYALLCQDESDKQYRLFLFDLVDGTLQHVCSTSKLNFVESAFEFEKRERLYAVETAYGLLFLRDFIKKEIRIFDIDTRKEHTGIKLPFSPKDWILPKYQVIGPLHIRDDKLYLFGDSKVDDPWKNTLYCYNLFESTLE